MKVSLTFFILCVVFFAGYEAEKGRKISNFKQPERPSKECINCIRAGGSRLCRPCYRNPHTRECHQCLQEKLPQCLAPCGGFGAAQGVCSQCGTCSCCLGACIFGACVPFCVPAAYTGMPTEEACYSNALHIIKSDDCKGNCGANTRGYATAPDVAACNTCIKDHSALEPTCKAMHIQSGSCFACTFTVIHAIYGCKDKPEIPEKAHCVMEKVPGNCKDCLCSIICKSSLSIAKSVCKFLQSSGLC